MSKTLTFLLVACVAGCVTAGGSGLRGKVDVLGVELGSPAQYREINGVAGTEEPCLRGYERRFDPLDLSIGYGFDGRIRRISTQNSKTSIFGIRPGTPAVDGAERVAREGLRATNTPYKYRGDGYYLSLLVDEAGKIRGITIENGD
jgi:hypothetical protein